MAYYEVASLTKKTVLIALTLGITVKQLFFYFTDSLTIWARVFFY
jgi:hypothetical protein